MPKRDSSFDQDRAGDGDGPRTEEFTAPTAASSSKAGEENRFGNRYLVTGLLAKGATSQVFEARHFATGAPVAIKTLRIRDPADATDDAQHRFAREASLTARLSHPNTVRVFDFGETIEGEGYLVMERLIGETLAEVLERHGENDGIDEDLTLEIAQGVLGSLAEAHAVGLVHRDLKPANIMLHRIAGGQLAVKVLDFGLATFQTLSGRWLAGTPSYMSPEQCRSMPLDGRSDLYSLGVILYQCLAGALPFQGDSLYDTLRMQTSEAPPPLAERVTRRLRPGLVRAVHCALDKDPDDRYVDAIAMLHDLELSTVTAAMRESDEFGKPGRVASGEHTRHGIGVPAELGFRTTGAPVGRFVSSGGKKPTSVLSRLPSRPAHTVTAELRAHRATSPGVAVQREKTVGDKDTVRARHDDIATIDVRADRRARRTTATGYSRRRKFVTGMVTSEHSPFRRGTDTYKRPADDEDEQASEPGEE